MSAAIPYINVISPWWWLKVNNGADPRPRVRNADNTEYSHTNLAEPGSIYTVLATCWNVDTSVWDVVLRVLPCLATFIFYHA